jgi:hypothetical protein
VSSLRVSETTMSVLNAACELYLGEHVGEYIGEKLTYDFAAELMGRIDDACDDLIEEVNETRTRAIRDVWMQCMRARGTR